jgi:hypothetical protein
MTRLSCPLAIEPNLTADASRTREADHVDERLLDERRARLRTARHNMEQPIGQAGFLKQPGEGHAAGHRRLHIRLQDHGVAHCEGGADRPRTHNVVSSTA